MEGRAVTPSGGGGYVRIVQRGECLQMTGERKSKAEGLDGEMQTGTRECAGGKVKEKDRRQQQQQQQDKKNTNNKTKTCIFVSFVMLESFGQINVGSVPN